MKAFSLSVLIVFLAGCGASSSSEEAKAAADLAPKPPTADQKAQMDKVKAQFPQGAESRPGHN